MPDEVSICGFTDGAIAQSTDPKLTTVEQHGEEVGKSAFGILTDKLTGTREKAPTRLCGQTCGKGTTNKTQPNSSIN